MGRKLNLVITGMLILLLGYSCKKDPEPSAIPEDVINTNKWIEETMNLYYYWNSYIPQDLDYKTEPDSKAYFEKLVYREKDDWSRITDDYQALQAELDGVPMTMGFYPSFFLVGPNKIAIVVNYVYPGSAADDAGLERGDIILKINNTALDTTNYYDLFTGNSYSVQLGELQGSTLVSTGVSLNLTAFVTSTDPSVHHEVIEVSGHKIGYLAYVEFIAGQNDALLGTMNGIFDEFKTAGITELIVDLRYNPGGDIKAAIQLASLIAPSSVVTNQDILIKYFYNTDLQNYLESQNSTSNLIVKFRNLTSNINMSRVFFLTTSGSASASELTIIGLRPYMDVVTIGEYTYGKYAGSWVIPDDNNVWAMMPIVMKFANSAGYTDFVNGLTPDYEIEDDPFHAVPFGDVTDPLTAKAIQLITGAPAKMAKEEKSALPMEIKQVFPKEMEGKRNLYIKKESIPEFKK